MIMWSSSSVVGGAREVCILDGAFHDIQHLLRLGEQQHLVPLVMPMPQHLQRSFLMVLDLYLRCSR